MLPRKPGSPYLRVPFGLARGAQLPTSRGRRCALGLYELELPKYFRALVTPSSACFDVGAGGGYYAVVLARRASQGRVVSFEPDAAAFAELEETLKRNPDLAERVVPVASGLGRVEDGGLTTIDAFVAERGAAFRPDFIKIDVDGPEEDVLVGGSSVIQESRPRIILETHGFEIEARCLQFLATCGYGYRVVNRRRVWAEYRPTELNRWVIAVHREDSQFDLVRR